MSHSSFKLIANDEPMNQNLIIVVNKNGSVRTDTATLQNLLSKSWTVFFFKQNYIAQL